MLNILEEALMELDDLRNPRGNRTITGDGDFPSILEHLYLLERADGELFRSAPSSSDAWLSDRDTLLEVGPDAIFRGPAHCHTALLPSRLRYDGLLREGGGVGDHRTGGFDRGFAKEIMKKVEGGHLPLAYDANDRQKCDLLEIDHKDFFYVREGDGWLGEMVPNPAGVVAFGVAGGDGNPRRGLIMVCLKICPLGRCSDDSVGFGQIKRNSGKLFIEVDGRPVKNIKRLEGCHFLIGENGVSWGPGNENGQYELRFLVQDPGIRVDNPFAGHISMKISSIVVF